MPNTYGVTPQGFFLKPLSQIVQDLSDAEVGTIDPALDTSAENPLGQLNGIVGNALAELWEIAQVAYDGISRDNAEGAALDNVGALTGSLRLPPKPSAVYCIVSAAAGTYPAGTLVASVGGGPSLPSGALPASVGQLFSNAQDLTIQPGQLNSLSVSGADDVLFTSEEDGPIVCPSGWLITIAVPVTGWNAITNAPNDAVLGNLLESDTAYRLRQEQELAAEGACTADAIRAAVFEVAAVNAVTVLENDTLVTSSGLPPKSFEVVVYTGPGVSLGDVAQAIWNNKPAGIQSFGASAATVLDSQGNPQTVYFTQVAQKQIYLAYVVSFQATLTPGDRKNAGLQLATTAMLLAQGSDYAGNPLDPSTPGVLAPGGPVVALAYEQLVFGVGGMTDMLALFLDTSPVSYSSGSGKQGTIPGIAGPSPYGGRTDTSIDGLHIGWVSLQDSFGAPAITVFDDSTNPPTQVYP